MPHLLYNVLTTVSVQNDGGARSELLIRDRIRQTSSAPEGVPYPDTVCVPSEQVGEDVQGSDGLVLRLPIQELNRRTLIDV